MKAEVRFLLACVRHKLMPVTSTYVNSPWHFPAVQRSARKLAMNLIHQNDDDTSIVYSTIKTCNPPFSFTRRPGIFLYPCRIFTLTILSQIINSVVRLALGDLYDPVMSSISRKRIITLVKLPDRSSKSELFRSSIILCALCIGFSILRHQVAAANADW